MSNPFRQLPAVNDILDTTEGQTLLASHPRERVVEAVRAELSELRQRLSRGETVADLSDPTAAAVRIGRRLEKSERPLLRAVINAGGIVLHTNLGRAPMAEAAASAARDAARGYLNLELDLDSGKRSSRQNPIRAWVQRLTGAESATVVNNNAAATVIVLRAICKGKEAIVSRGQLIEIGGSFRIPDIMSVSGAILKEVGTTNITRISDYEKAIGPNTGALMQIHTSNYRISGFTESASLAELVELGKRYQLPVIDDVGSGAMLDFNRFGLSGEPVVAASIKAGVDLVLFSGDKLLGGPQAGIIAGRKTLIQQIEKDPLMRAFRLDKMTLAALEATLRIYMDEERAMREIPVLRLLGLNPAELRRRAEALAIRLRELSALRNVEVREDVTYVGGGSLPDRTLPAVVVGVTTKHLPDTEFAQRLRTGTPAVVARLHEGKVLFDLRTVFPEQEEMLVGCIQKALE